MNYFALFSLTPQFELDIAALEAAYFTQMRQCHPDRFASKPALERQQAMQLAMDLNQAYNALKHPLPRAQHLLQLQGIAMGDAPGSMKPSPALLMEVMEWRERIEEASNLPQLETIENDLQGACNQSLKNMKAAYDCADWPGMAQETLRFSYCMKAQEELIMRKRHIKEKP